MWYPTLLAARAQLRTVDENVPQALAGWRPTVSISVVRRGDGFPQSRAPAALRPGRAALLLPAAAEPDRSAHGLAFAAAQHRPHRAQHRSPTASPSPSRCSAAAAPWPPPAAPRTRCWRQRARLLQTEQQILQQTIEAYVNVIRDQELLRLNINNEQVLTEQLRATSERFRVGEITRTDVAQAESRLAGARANRTQSEGNLQISRATFQRLVGAPPLRLIAPQPLRPPVRTAQEAGLIAAANNPNVVAALFDEAQARDVIDIQLSNLAPQLSVAGPGLPQRQPAPAAHPHHRRPAHRQPHRQVYQGGAEYSAVRQARQDAQRSARRWTSSAARRRSRRRQAWEQYQSSRAQVDSQRAAIRASEIALDGVQREAIVGSRTTLEVLNQEQELLQNRTNLVQALATAVLQSYTLAVGGRTAHRPGSRPRRRALRHARLLQRGPEPLGRPRRLFRCRRAGCGKAALRRSRPPRRQRRGRRRDPAGPTLMADPHPSSPPHRPGGPPAPAAGRIGRSEHGGHPGLHPSHPERGRGGRAPRPRLRRAGRPRGGAARPHARDARRRPARGPRRRRPRRRLPLRCSCSPRKPRHRRPPNRLPPPRPHRCQPQLRSREPTRCSRQRQRRRPPPPSAAFSAPSPPSAEAAWRAAAAPPSRTWCARSCGPC